MTWWATQRKIARLLLEPPYRCLAVSANNVGKTFLEGSLVNFWYDTRPQSAVITTAPTKEAVVDLLWKEVRLQRRRAGLSNDFCGPRAPEMRTADDHWAKGYTTDKGEAFHGRHHEHMLFLMDEATGIDDPDVWEGTRSMFQADGKHAWLCCFNPTNTSTPAYQEYLHAGKGYPKSGWHVVHMDARDHPNIAAELVGKAPPYPGAIRLATLEEWISKWTTPIDREEAIATDFCWPPPGPDDPTGETRQWVRPGPLFEIRGMGCWASQATYSVWGNALWRRVEQSKGEIDPLSVPSIGCDVAYFGDDFTSIHVRDGWVSLHHETHNGWEPDQTAGRLKQLCRESSEYCKTGIWRGRFIGKKNPDLGNNARSQPRAVRVKVDVDGPGAGVLSHRKEPDGGPYNFMGVTASSPAGLEYRNRRSALWFNLAHLAKRGCVHMGRLDETSLANLREQAMSPVYEVNGAGQLEVEPKDETKDRLRRSPDDMDAANLAYFEPAAFEAPPVAKDVPKRDIRQHLAQHDPDRQARIRRLRRP